MTVTQSAPEFDPDAVSAKASHLVRIFALLEELNTQYDLFVEPDDDGRWPALELDGEGFDSGEFRKALEFVFLAIERTPQLQPKNLPPWAREAGEQIAVRFVDLE